MKVLYRSKSNNGYQVLDVHEFSTPANLQVRECDVPVVVTFNGRALFRTKRKKIGRNNVPVGAKLTNWKVKLSKVYFVSNIHVYFLYVILAFTVALAIKGAAE